MTWISCFTLYTAVMSQKRTELAAPMMAHLHMVIRLHNLGGLTWFHYDWKARQETCVMGPVEWGKCDPRQLMCTTGSGFVEDPFDPPPEGTSMGKEGNLSHTMSARPTQIPTQQQPGGNGARKQRGICRLFNRALWDAHMVTNVFFFIGARSVDALIMVGGIVQRRQEVQCLEDSGPPGRTKWYI